MKVRTSLKAGAQDNAQAIAQAKAQGLGDQIAGFTRLTGLDRLAHAYEDLTGKDCGCDARRQKLNQLFPTQSGV